MQSASWQKESEEIIVRRVVRRLDRFLTDWERQRAQKDAESPMGFQADAEGTSTKILAAPPAENSGKEVLTVREEQTPRPFTPTTDPVREAPSPPALQKAPPLPSGKGSVLVKEPSLFVSDNSSPAPAQAKPKPKVPSQMIKPPPPPRKRVENVDPVADEFANDHDADSRVDRLFSERREALVASDRMASKAFFWALAVLVIVIALFVAFTPI